MVPLPVCTPLTTQSIWPNRKGEVDVNLMKDFLLAEGDLRKTDFIQL
jgi:hypothetical protein